jgi:hypothetical protein
MDKIKKLLDIDDDVDQFTKPPKKDKGNTTIKDVVTLIEDYNLMADLLQLPETSQKNNYLLNIVDLATHEFDMEPLKTKESEEVKTAMETIFKRKYVKMPKASIRTDNGTEFKGEVDKYLKDNDIFHSVSMPYRHTQLSAVESLNKQIGYLLNSYMNSKEFKTKTVFRDWDDPKILELVRVNLNELRKKDAPYTEKTIFDHVDKSVNLKATPKFQVGDIVHYALTYPENALGEKQPTANFRVGDFRWSPVPKKIKQVLYYTGAIPFRYMLDEMPEVSFTENQLMKSKEEEQKFVVKEIIGEKTQKKKKYYQVWWKGYLKKDATFEPEDQLIEDGLEDYITAFKEKKKEDAKKKADERKKAAEKKAAEKKVPVRKQPPRGRR